MRTDETLWAITTYFNPVRYRSRRENYRIFRDRLSVPLIAMEYAVDEFQLEEQDADILVQLRGPDVMWQKERLYNIARRHLPSHCEQVLWIDCDLVFGAPDWPELLKQALRSRPLVHPFREMAFLDQGVLPPPTRDDQIVERRTSLVAWLADGGDAEAIYSQWGISLKLKYFHGGAWAARREVCEQFDFYDRLIIGGGDKAFTAALLGRHEILAPTFVFDEQYRQDYLQWAGALHELAHGAVGQIDQTVYHLWHGDMINRAYDNRQARLRDVGFSAMDDLQYDPQTGCWRWATDKPALHDFVRGHFIRRQEDG